MMSINDRILLTATPQTQSVETDNLGIYMLKFRFNQFEDPFKAWKVIGDIKTCADIEQTGIKRFK